MVAKSFIQFLFGVAIILTISDFAYSRDGCGLGHEWTAWYDRDDPSDTADFEGLSELRRENPGEICQFPTNAEARLVGTETLYTSNDVNIVFNARVGFACWNTPNRQCQDYEVRFCCPVVECPDHSTWTTWYDRDDPSFTADAEALDLLREENPGEICENPSAIQARLVKSGVMYNSFEPNINFNTEVGFICWNTADTQCQDYEVRFCCPNPVLPNVGEEVICEHESREITCPEGEVIWVKEAFYGRDDDDTCPSNSIKTTDCAADGSLQEIRSSCNGRNSCSVTASNSIFGDPCVGTFKYVEMEFFCRPSSRITTNICEGTSQTLTCGDNQEIFLLGGFYGRTNRLTCPSSAIKTTRCAASGSFDRLKSACDGMNSCTVEATNEVFGDPCVGTFKYVELTYECRDRIDENPCIDENGMPISGNPFEKPGDCNNFFQCSNGILHTLPCAPGTVFNPEIGVCDFASNVPGCS